MSLSLIVHLAWQRWRFESRDERGGVLDDAGLIAIGFAAAVMIGGAVYALVSNVELNFGELWGE